MNILLTLIAAIIIFSVLVLVHEWGHFYVARRNGIKVEEFGFGFPPRLWSRKHNGVLYSLNAIPFGGFVRMFGEDATDPKFLKSRQSFIAKTKWQRTKVIVAGVFMNVVLAVVLLTVGFTFGIEPLIVSGEDLMAEVERGNVDLQHGVFIEKVKAGSQAAQLGLAPGDEIIAVNDLPLMQVDQINALLEEDLRTEDYDMRVLSGNLAGDGAVRDVHFIAEGDGGNDWGLTMKSMTSLPRIAFLEVENGSPFALAGILPGDRILRVNGKEIFSESSWLELVKAGEPLQLNMLRGRDLVDLRMDPPSERVIISDVLIDTPAAKAELRTGDTIIAINDEPVANPGRVQELIKGSPRMVKIRVSQNGTERTLFIRPGENGLLGIAVSQHSDYRSYVGSWYTSFVLTSLADIHDVRYPVHLAFVNAFKETYRLTVLTAETFGTMLQNIITKQEVPDEVGGPVRIAVYTHTFVQEGFFALLRFTALLSISLAVLNILPFPALDGGRLLFIVIEAVTGRRVNQKVEAVIHNLGFAILIFLVLLITYNDFLQIF